MVHTGKWIVLVRLNEIRDIGIAVLLRQVGEIQWLLQDTRFVEGLLYTKGR
jgi:hypothetical protein